MVWDLQKLIYTYNPGFSKYGCLGAERAIGIFSRSTVTVKLPLCKTTNAHGAAHCRATRYTQHYMYEGYLISEVEISSGRASRLPLEQEAEWAPEPDWTL